MFRLVTEWTVCALFVYLVFLVIRQIWRLVDIKMKSEQIELADKLAKEIDKIRETVKNYRNKL